MSVVKNEIINAKSYPASPETTGQLITEFDIEIHRYCDLEFDCYNYYFAPNKAQKQKLSLNIDAQFTDKAHSTSLLVERGDIPQFTGNVIILHGFRGSKDWSLISAAYFQFLGFDVYLLDLLGHGELDVDKGFGVTDVAYIQRFVENQLDGVKPTLVVGNSMGGLVATSLVNQDVADGAILQAPMTRFDHSLVAYVRDRQPWYGILLSNDTLQTAANQALQEQGLTAVQTNTINLLQESHSPVLIFASNTDGVAPYAAYAPLHGDNINVVEIDQVEHAYMSMIGQSEHENIVDWLTANFAE